MTLIVAGPDFRGANDEMRLARSLLIYPLQMVIAERESGGQLGYGSGQVDHLAVLQNDLALLQRVGKSKL